MLNPLWIAVFGALLLLQSYGQVQATEDSFLLYAWACPDDESYAKSRKAFVNLDQEAFEATDCVSIRPEIEYRLLRCDPDIPEEDLERFGYEIERSEELTFNRCEISITNQDGSTKIHLIRYTKLPLLRLRPD